MTRTPSPPARTPPGPATTPARPPRASAALDGFDAERDLAPSEARLSDLQALVPGSPATDPTRQLQALAAARPVMQLGGGKPGGNPKGRGGRGGYQPPKKPPRRSDKGSWINEERRKQARKPPKAAPPGRRAPAAADPFARPPAPGPQPRAAAQPDLRRADPPERLQPDPVAVPMPPMMVEVPLDVPPDRDRGGAVAIPMPPMMEEVPLDAPPPDRDRPGEVMIDMAGMEAGGLDPVGPGRGDAGPGFWARVGGQLFEGRTFTDTANMLGGAASLGGGQVGASLGIVAGAGVLLTALAEYRSALLADTGTGRERREFGAMLGASGGDFMSGAAAIMSGAFALYELTHGDTIHANSSLHASASLAGMAAAEAVNVLLQIDLIARATADNKPWRSFVKPILSLLQSLAKCIGCVIAISLSMEDGLGVMMAGAGFGMLHGVVKLIMMCCEATEAADPLEPDPA